MATDGGQLTSFLEKLKKAVKIAALLLFLLAGVTSGLFMGGGIYSIADRMAPWVEGFPILGRRVYPLLERMSPPATGYERRRLELEDEKEYLMDESKTLDAEKTELAREKQELNSQMDLLAKKLADIAEVKKQNVPRKEEEPALFDVIAESFVEMPPSKSAKVIVLLPLKEAASILKSMDAEQRSQVLGKMSPDAAARLVRFAKAEFGNT